MASAPAATAISTSSGVVTPQIFTRVMVTLLYLETVLPRRSVSRYNISPHNNSPHGWETAPRDDIRNPRGPPRLAHQRRQQWAGVSRPAHRRVFSRPVPVAAPRPRAVRRLVVC